MYNRGLENHLREVEIDTGDRDAAAPGPERLLVDNVSQDRYLFKLEFTEQYPRAVCLTPPVILTTPTSLFETGRSAAHFCSPDSGAPNFCGFNYAT